MARRIVLPVFALTWLTCVAHSSASPQHSIDFTLAVSESGSALEKVKLEPLGGKIALPRGAWRCDYGAVDSSGSGDQKHAKLSLRCSMGAAVVRIETSCRYTEGPARRDSDVLRDAQGLSLTLPNGGYSAFLALGCQVRSGR